MSLSPEVDIFMSHYKNLFYLTELRYAERPQIFILDFIVHAKQPDRESYGFQMIHMYHHTLNLMQKVNALKAQGFDYEGIMRSCLGVLKAIANYKIDNDQSSPPLAYELQIQPTTSNASDPTMLRCAFHAMREGEEGWLMQYIHALMSQDEQRTKRVKC